MFSEMTWMNEPPEWSVEDDVLRVVTGLRTDFWLTTFYGFERDSGHFFYREVAGDFSAEVTLAGNFDELYDQSGLMVRVDHDNWLKAGIEFSDGARQLSTVVTRGFSDWSMTPLPEITPHPGPLRLRVTRHDSAVRVQCRDETGGWSMVRLGYLPMGTTVDVGVMCCSPEREGFAAIFTDFAISAPISRNLHE